MRCSHGSLRPGLPRSGFRRTLPAVAESSFAPIRVDKAALNSVETSLETSSRHGKPSYRGPRIWASTKSCHVVRVRLSCSCVRVRLGGSTRINEDSAGGGMVAYGKRRRGVAHAVVLQAYLTHRIRQPVVCEPISSIWSRSPQGGLPAGTVGSILPAALR